MVEDKARESRVQAICTSAILTILHPRTYFSVNLACLALLDASVPLNFLLASVTVVRTEDGRIICDPTNKQLRSTQCLATSTFVFSNKSQDSKAPSIVSSYTDGLLSPVQLQESLSAAHEA